MKTDSKKNGFFLVLVGADHRGLGKTTLSAALAERLTANGTVVYAMKIRGIPPEAGDSACWLEDRQEKKPGVQALFLAGCREVVHIMAKPHDRLPLFERALQDLNLVRTPAACHIDRPRAVLICESNALRKDLLPDLFIHIDGSGDSIKASAKATRDLADLHLSFPFSDHDLDTVWNVLRTTFYS